MAAVNEQFAPRGKRAILFITLHGELNGDDLQQYDGDMKIRKINAVDAGVCNILSDATANAIIKYFQNRTRSLYRLPIDDTANYISNRTGEMDPIYSHASVRGSTSKTLANATNFIESDLIEYVNHSHHYEQHKLNGKYFNKKYILVPEEKALPHNKMNNSIYLMDETGKFEDLTETLPQLSRWRNKIKSGDHLELTTDALLEYIDDDLGYTELVIMDLSCMVNTNDPDANDRDLRDFTRRVRNLGHARGTRRRKAKKARHKTKERKKKKSRQYK